MMQMIGSFAEFERALLRERTKSGLAAARQDGRVGGRSPKINTPATKKDCLARHIGAENRG